MGEVSDRVSAMVSCNPAQVRVKTRVLIVDDDAEYRRGLRTALERAGWQAHECDDPRVVLETCRAIAPSIILLDIAVGGHELLRQKQQDPRVMYIPVIALTNADIGASISTGVVRQLRKQVAPEVVIEIIRVVVGAARSGAA